MAKQRNGPCDFSLVKIGRISTSDISRILSGKFKMGATLVSDKHGSIVGFAKKENVKHRTFKAKEHVKNQNCHVQTINQIAGNLKHKLNCVLRGVSTKYLQNYVTWFGVKDSDATVKSLIQKCLGNKKSWDMFMNIEKLYEQFILNHSVRTYRCPVKRFRKSQYWNFDSAKEGVFWKACQKTLSLEKYYQHRFPIEPFAFDNDKFKVKIE